MKTVFKVFCSILATAALCALAAGVAADYFEGKAFRELIKTQHEDKTLEIGSRVEQALWRFALEKTDARNPFDLEYSIDRVPVTGRHGVYIYTVRFMDREFIRPVETAEATP